MRIDAHQHFWKFDPIRDSWIGPEMSLIQKDFFPKDIKPLLQQNGFDGCVAVQASHSEEENDFLISLARTHPFIKGIVGWANLQAADIDERLGYYKQHKIIKGFRHVLQGEPQRDLMLQPSFKAGIAALGKTGFTYDILIFPDQLDFSTQLAAQFPDQKFVIDHLAKPFIKRKELQPWKRDIQSIAAHQNVWCKLSGMVTEGNWHGWAKDDFTPYLDTVVEAFGVERIMFGTDWPVCTVTASYGEVVRILNDYCASFTVAEQEKIFGGNAVQFYGL